LLIGRAGWIGLATAASIVIRLHQPDVHDQAGARRQ
jgi:hypothetical protein